MPLQPTPSRRRGRLSRLRPRPRQASLRPCSSCFRLSCAASLSPPVPRARLSSAGRLAPGPQLWLAHQRHAVLTRQLHGRAPGAAAEALAVDDQPFAAAQQADVDTREGDVRNRLEDGAQTTVDTVDASERVDLDLAVQVKG